MRRNKQDEPTQSRRVRTKNDRMPWPAFFFFLCLIVGGFLLGNAFLNKRATDLTNEAGSLHSDLQALNDEADRLQTERDYIGTDDFYITEGRESYNFVSAGEKSFRITNPDQLDRLTDAEFEIWVREDRHY